MVQIVKKFRSSLMVALAVVVVAIAQVPHAFAATTDLSTTTMVSEASSFISDASLVMAAWVLGTLALAAILIGLRFGYSYFKKTAIGRRAGLSG